MTTFTNTAGDDIFIGSGSDTVSYLAATASVTVSLALQGSPQNTGGAGNDTLFGIANLVGPQSYGSTLTGDANANDISGGNGNDILEGGLGADYISGGKGNDIIIVRAGDFALGETDDGGHIGIQETNTLEVIGSLDFTVGRVMNFEILLFNNAAGTAGAASLLAIQVPRSIVGGAGADTLEIHASSVLPPSVFSTSSLTFFNWSANDTVAFVGSTADETFNVDTQLPGGYRITTGAGKDVIALQPVTGSPETFAPTVVTDFQPGWDGDQLRISAFATSLFPNFATLAPYAADLLATGHMRLVASGPDALLQMDPAGSGAWTTLVTLKGVDPQSLIWSNLDVAPAAAGSYLSPVLAPPANLVQTGSTTAKNILNGGAGADTLVGGPLADTFHGGPGSDRITGGGGIDTALYDGVFRNYTVVVRSQVTSVIGGPEGGADLLLGVARAQFVDGYLATDVNDYAAQVYRLYGATLGRAPDPAGLTNWTHALEGGASLQSIIPGFVNSAEFQANYAGLYDTSFVTLLYHNVLNRAPDPAGLNNWLSFLAAGHSRAEVVQGFSESPEYALETSIQVGSGLWVGDAAAAETARLYDTVLGRLPDAPGLANWTHSLETGTTLLQVTQGFVGSIEFQSVYGSLGDSQFVQLLYQNALHRAADPAGLNNWVSLLATGHSRAEVVLGFSESPEHIANTASHVDNGIWVAA